MLAFFIMYLETNRSHRRIPKHKWQHLTDLLICIFIYVFGMWGTFYCHSPRSPPQELPLPERGLGFAYLCPKKGRKKCRTSASRLPASEPPSEESVSLTGVHYGQSAAGRQACRPMARWHPGVDSRTPEGLGREGSRGRGVTSGGGADQWAVASSPQDRALADAMTSARVSAL